MSEKDSVMALTLLAAIAGWMMGGGLGALVAVVWLHWAMGW